MGSTPGSQTTRNETRVENHATQTADAQIDTIVTTGMGYHKHKDTHSAARKKEGGSRRHHREAVSFNEFITPDKNRILPNIGGITPDFDRLPAKTGYCRISGHYPQFRPSGNLRGLAGGYQGIVRLPSCSNAVAAGRRLELGCGLLSRQR
jgi:hypothetical protein